MTTVLRRLRHLNEEGLIQKIFGLETSERLWALTKKAVDKFEFESAKTNFPRAILEHDATLSTLRMRLENSGIVQSWIAEHTVRKRVAAKHGVSGMKKRIVPDGIMGVRVGETNQSVAVELELSNKNQERYRQILWNYAKKESLYAVWYVVNSKTIQKQIEEAKKWVYFDSASPKLLFSNIDDVLGDPPVAFIGSTEEAHTVRDLFVNQTAHTPAHPVSDANDAIAQSQTPLNLS